MARGKPACHPKQPLHAREMCRPCYAAWRKDQRTTTAAKSDTAKASTKKPASKAPAAKASNVVPLKERPATPAPKPSGKGKASALSNHVAKARKRTTKAAASGDAAADEAVSVVAIELANAKALIDSIDKMPAPEAVKRIGKDDAQHALDVIAKGKRFRDPGNAEVAA